ncbi:hypothetical protein GCK32_001850 [Trichostrongylus colubriformis]|uniref:Uncharacterized protein n=1 Tax=Trichostrongylus colubriformis TaxID=6319 RepID=A0AAN8FY14_TRICO
MPDLLHSLLHLKMLNNFHIMERRRSPLFQMNTSTMGLRIALLVGGTFMAAIHAVLIHQYECCGIYSVSDYYTARQISFPPEHLETREANTSTTVNQSQVGTGSPFGKQQQYVPYFEQMGPRMFSVSFRTLEYDGYLLCAIVLLCRPPQIYRYSCAQRIASNYRDKSMVLTLLAGIIALVAIVNAIHLLVWRSRLQPSSKSSVSPNSTSSTVNV